MICLTFQFIATPPAIITCMKRHTVEGYTVIILKEAGLSNGISKGDESDDGGSLLTVSQNYGKERKYIFEF